VLIENTLFGVRDKVKIAIDRLQAFEPLEGYYLAFSGGKDSQCIYHLAVEAGVKFDAHYNHTTVDPPELIYFIRKNYPDVSVDRPKETMWQLIIKNGGPPSRIQRYCCRELKERGGEGRVCVTGVRWAESVRRAKTRGLAEFMGRKTKDKVLFNDNDSMRQMMENCQLKGKYVLNPIIDWTDEDVWEYIRSRNIKYCELYDEGFKRLGCVGCPMSGMNGMTRDFERWPKYKAAYIRAFEKAVARRKANGKPCSWQNGEDVFNWWVYSQNGQEKEVEGQIDIWEDE
jgi:phosphoadenosine phosphosulfate reductase